MSTFLSKLTRRVSTARALWAGADRSLLFQMTLFAALVPLLMRVPPRQLDRLIAPRRSPGAVPSPQQIESIVRHLRMARQLGSPLVRSGCLTRGLTLYCFLRRAGLEVSLCFGIRRVASGFTGHCWLSRAGEPFLEEPDPRPLYAPIFSIPLEAPPPARMRDLTCP